MSYYYNSKVLDSVDLLYAVDEIVSLFSLTQRVYTDIRKSTGLAG